MMSCTRHSARQFRRLRDATPPPAVPSRCPNAVRERVTPGRIARPQSMRKTLAVVGSVAVSSLFGWLGSQYGLMTGFMLGMIGTGVGMYAGYRLAEHLGS
jgi:hypothetical protein